MTTHQHLGRSILLFFFMFGGLAVGQEEMVEGAIFHGNPDFYGGNGDDLMITVDPVVQDALDGTASILNQYVEISSDAEETNYRWWRETTLAPAIDNLTEIARKTKNKEVLYSAIALASCDRYAEDRGGVWSVKLGRAMEEFSGADIQDVFSRLSPEGQRVVRDRVVRESREGSAVKDILSKIQITSWDDEVLPP